jgi:hypothetical protein
MGLLPEREPHKNVIERPDEASDLQIERKTVITATPVAVKAQVQDDKGNNLIQTPQNQKVVIKIPAVSKESLDETANKGDKEDSKTWWAASWIRTILKALFGDKEIVYDAN